MPNSYSFFSVCKEYFGDTAILPLVVIAVVWLLRKWNIQKQRAFLLAGGISVITLYNGVIYYLTGKVGESETYYRFFWICPLILSVAIFLVEIIFSVEGKKRFAMLSVLLVGIFLFMSKLPSTWVNIPQNVYQIDTEVVEIADIIFELENGKQTTMIDNGDISYTIRQYSSQIGFTELALESIDYVLSGRNSNYIGRYLLEYFANNNSDYYVLKKEKPDVCRIVESMDLNLVAESQDYYIYHMDGNRIKEERKWIIEQENLYFNKYNLEYIQIAGLETTVEIVYMSDFGTIENEAAYRNVLECISEMQPDTIIINSCLSEQSDWYIEKKAELDALGIPYYYNDQNFQVINQDGFIICLIDNLLEVTESTKKRLEELNEEGVPVILVLAAELKENDDLYSVVMSEDSQVVQVLSARKNEYFKSVLEGETIQYATPADNNTMFNVIRVKGK